MIAIQHLPLRRIVITALVAFVAGFVSYPSAHAQQTGPTVDECSSGEVDSSYGVEETVCLSGSQSGLTAYAEVDNGGGGSGAANWVGVAATLLKSSTTVWSSGDVSGSPEESVSGGVTPVLNVWYTLNTTFDEGVCNGSGGCNSWYGMGGLSVAVEVTAGAPPAPTNLAAQPGNASASLTWTASSGATSYNVYQGTSSGGENSTPVATGITGTSYTVTGLTNGTTYYFKVAAVSTGGTSGYSNETSTTPQPPATTVYSYSVNYDTASNVSGYNDSVMGTWSVVTSGGNSGYDSLNRLVAAKATAGPYQNLQVSWSPDSFGNRKVESFSGTPTGNVPVPPSTNITFNSKNQVQSVQSGYPPRYDAAGNVICDSYNSGTGQCVISASSNVYAYDVEGRICAVDTSSGAFGYLYDAEGTRVAKGTISVVWVTVNGQQVLSCDTNSSDTTTYNHFSVTTAYVLDSGDQQMTEVTSSNGGSQWTWKHTNVWAGGQLVATYSTSSGQAALNFHFTDWLGTRRVLTDSLGNTQQTCHSLPYGNGEDCSTTPTENLFTGKERDSETNNDYFEARYYENSMGRFMSPDWSAQEEPVPYAKLDDPQSFNLYAYVRNNPITGIDANGHFGPIYSHGTSQDQACAEGATGECGDAGPAAASAERQDEQNRRDRDTSVGGFFREIKDALVSAFTTKEGFEKYVENNPAALVMGGGESEVANEGTRLVSTIGNDTKLVKYAEEAGKSVQKGLDHLVEELGKGNTNPGIGTKGLGDGISYARARDGARVFFQKENDTITIIAKASKANESQVIKYLKTLY